MKTKFYFIIIIIPFASLINGCKDDDLISQPIIVHNSLGSTEDCYNEKYFSGIGYEFGYEHAKYFITNELSKTGTIESIEFPFRNSEPYEQFYSISILNYESGRPGEMIENSRIDFSYDLDSISIVKIIPQQQIFLNANSSYYLAMKIVQLLIGKVIP